MKFIIPVLAAVLVVGCKAAPDAPTPVAATPAPAAAETAPAVPAPMTSEAKRASATGTVRSIDATAHAITIAHGPVESLGWPEMTMTFQAPGVDLSTIQAGDEVDFEFTSTGMNGTIDSIAKR